MKRTLSIKKTAGKQQSIYTSIDHYPTMPTGYVLTACLAISLSMYPAHLYTGFAKVWEEMKKQKEYEGRVGWNERRTAVTLLNCEIKTKKKNEDARTKDFTSTTEQ